MNWFTNFFKKLFSNEKPWRNAQEYINKKYPLLKRRGVTELLLQNLRLKGSLSLKGFVEVEVINCRHNRITSLDLSDCKNLRKLYCDDNQRIKNLDLSSLSNLEWLDVFDNRFTDLSFLNTIPNPEKLQALVMCDNRLPPINLDWVSRFTNLELLLIGNHGKLIKNKDRQEVIQFGNYKYNLFYGSLKPLKKTEKISSS